MTSYVPSKDRYQSMTYPVVDAAACSCPPYSLGLWQNFGDDRPLETQRSVVRRAFDLGITHFDLANNYGPPYGSAERTGCPLGKSEASTYRKEAIHEVVAKLECRVVLDHQPFEIVSTLVGVDHLTGRHRSDLAPMRTRV